MGIGGVETVILNQVTAFTKRGYNVYVAAGNGKYSNKVEELGGMNFRVHFTGEDANPVMELMVNTSRQRGWNLKEIRLEKSSLDVIFAELSKK